MAGIARLGRFERVASTQDVVRGWLAAYEPEICVAVADEQTAGRGRRDRAWLAPPGTALLVSAGFRPTDLAPELAWRLGAIVALAMLEAVEDVSGSAASRLALKWPNDLVTREGGRIAKVGGVLGETLPDDGRVGAAIVGIGLNVDWPARAFPPQLAGSMSSLREVLGRPVDRERVLDAFLARLTSAYDEFARGAFPADRWAAHQVTTGARVSVDVGDRVVRGSGLGVDPDGGGLIVLAEPAGVPQTVLAGDVVRCVVTEVEARL